MSDSKPALVVQNLSRRFGRTVALNGLSLSIPEKSVTAFVGANGAGKTTTFSVIGQFIRAHAGSVEVFGVPLADYRRQGGIIGILPQDMQFFEDRTIGRQLLLFARLAGLARPEAEREVMRVLALTKLTDRIHDQAASLSHGMRVRLGVAQALIANPPLILLDEPTAGLDPRMIVDFRETVDAVRGRTTLVISSHDLSELQEMCDFVCMIDHGKLVMQGPMEQMLSGVSSIRFSVAALTRDPRELEQQLPAVDFIVEDKQTLVVEFDRTRYQIADINRAVLAWLLNNGMQVLEVRQHKSLEQTFLEATGH